jgi:hypothetical protein
MSLDNRIFLKQCLLESTSNDYENIETLAPEVARWAKEENQSCSYETIIAALEELTLGGLIQVYRYSKQGNKFEKTDFDSQAIKELWFRALRREQS